MTLTLVESERTPGGDRLQLKITGVMPGPTQTFKDRRKR